jgi:hypothetical protein
MSSNRELIDMATGQIFEDMESTNKKDDVRSISIHDAQYETAKILVPQIGSDKKDLQKGRIDVRRMSDINAVDVYWLMFFKTLEMYEPLIGKYTKAIQEEYLNHRYSVGGKNKDKMVSMTEAVSGKRKETEDKPDSKKWYQFWRGKSKE